MKDYFVCEREHTHNEWMGMVSASMLSRQRAKNHFSSKFPQRDKDNNHDDDVNGSNGGERHFIAKDVQYQWQREKTRKSW